MILAGAMGAENGVPCMANGHLGTEASQIGFKITAQDKRALAVLVEG